MKDAVSTLLKTHGGKTVTISFSTLAALVWLGTEAGYVPVPATRDYVDQVVGEQTKGLDYLVRKELEHDLDVLNYVVACMGDVRQGGALRRLEEQYLEWFEVSYRHKSCEQLERNPTIAAAAAGQ